MIKAALLAFIGLATVASAADQIEITPMHFIKAGALSSPLSMVKSLTRPALKDNVVWGACPDDKSFKDDKTKTYNLPQPPVKGTNVQLFLAGTFMNDVDLAGLKVFVTWNDNPLYVNDFPRSAHYDEGTPYKDNITWLIPSFAPSGHYHVELTLHDNAKKPEIYGCLTADFNL